MTTAKQMINSIKPHAVKGKAVELGQMGYDNPRDDIERVKKMREGEVVKVPATDYDISNKKYVDDEIITYTFDLRNNSIANTLHKHSELVYANNPVLVALTADVNGNIGMGTATPNWNLQLHNSGTGAGDHSICQLTTGNSGSGASNGFAFGYYGGNYGVVWNFENTNVYYGTNNTTRMTILNNGRISIGGTGTAGTSCNPDLVNTTSAIRLNRLTTTQKNNLTASNGMLIYDTTLNKFQGYENGAWVNLI